MTTSSADDAGRSARRRGRGARASRLGREQRERPLPAGRARPRPVDVPRARARVRAQHAARPLQAGGVRRRLGGAAAAPRGRSSSRSSSAGSPACRRDGIPYPVFNYSAMILWLYVSLGVAAAAQSLVENRDLITKVYFAAARRAALRGAPRARRPRDRIRRARRDARRLRRDARAGRSCSPRSGSSPRCSSSLAVGFPLSALNVRYRDVRLALPLAAAALALREPGRVLELARRGRAGSTSTP